MSTEPLTPGTRVQVTYTGVIEQTRVDGDGPAYAINHDQGYGHTYAKEAAGDTITVLAPGAATTVTFTIDGVIANMQNAPDKDKCACCGGRRHVFWYGINLPYTVPGINGPAEAQPRDWINQVLDDYRFDAGRPVRITVEILDMPEGSAGPDVSVP